MGAPAAVLALALALGPAAQGEPARPHGPELAAAVDALFTAWDRPDRPGCVVGVIADGTLVHARGFGSADLEHGRPLGPESVLDIGSVSKHVTAACLALLVLDGKLALDDDVRRFVPELPEPPRPVTLRHLLHHRGGLPDYVGALLEGGAEIADVTTEAEALAALVRLTEVEFPAGERFEYSNTGYFLLGLVVARAAGTTLARFAEERLFGPLGMAATSYRDDHRQLVPDRARAYSAPLGSERIRLDESDWEQVGDGSVFTSVVDLARWIANLEHGTVGGPGFVELMSLPGLPVDDADASTTYGMGMEHGRWNGRRSVRHGGSWAGYRAHLLWLPEEHLAVVILANMAEAQGLARKAEQVAERVLGLRAPAPETSWLVRDALLVDGTGAAPRRGDLRVAGERIAAVGALQPLPGERVLDAGGKVLAPGFVDTHSHADGALDRDPAALAAVSQGITTVVCGQDGASADDLVQFFAHLESAAPAVNVASYAGHGTLRAQVLGSDFRRAASAAEVERMAALLDGAMQAGALGLSTGLEYEPGLHAETAELIALARVAARHGGRYISHVRSEDRHFWEAIEELLTIGREARLPVQVSHLKLAMRSLWGQAPRLLARLDQARREGIDVSADVYPYLFWQSTLAVLFPARDFEDLDEARLVLDQIAPPEGLCLALYTPEPSYAGKTVAEIAALRNEEPAATLLQLIQRAEALRQFGEEGQLESVIGTSMTEADLEQLLSWPHANLCTDGELDGAHPRGFGAAARFLGRYVRERKLVPLAEAVRKLSSLAADHVGLTERGRLVPGAHADLVLFDPATIADRATSAEPHALAAGVERVWVNGVLVYADGKATGKRPGRVLRRPAAAAGGAR